MRDWRLYLRQDPEANQALTAELDGQIRAAQQQMEDAPSWEAVLEARGKKKVLAIILASLTMADREEQQHARAFGNARRTRDT